MPWTAILAVFSLLAVQGAFVAACLYAYNRIRSLQDSQGQEKTQWGLQVQGAVAQADSALKKASEIETAHFGKLRALFEAQAVEVSDARARITSLEKELKVCQMKLASEERINRRDEKRRQREEEEEPAQPAGVPAAPGGDLDSLLRQFGTPMTAVQPAAPAAPAAGFGQTAKPRGG